MVPVVVAFEKGVVDGVKVAAMGAGGVVPSVPPESEGIAGVECVSSDELESG